MPLTRLTPAPVPSTTTESIENVHRGDGIVPQYDPIDMDQWMEQFNDITDGDIITIETSRRRYCDVEVGDVTDSTIREGTAIDCRIPDSPYNIRLFNYGYAQLVPGAGDTEKGQLEDLVKVIR